MNLEPFGASENYFFSDGSTNFSDVIYALKSRKSNLIMKLESMIKTDRSGVDFFDSCRNAYDMQDLKDEEVARLIQGISQLREYSDIIIDVSGDLGSRMLLLMQEYADTIICVNDGSSVGNRKFLRLYEALRIYEQRTEKKVSEKISLLYNQFDSKAGQQIENSPVPVIGKISFYEGCADRILLEQIEKNPVMGKI